MENQTDNMDNKKNDKTKKMYYNTTKLEGKEKRPWLSQFYLQLHIITTITTLR